MGTFTLGTPILLANGYQMTFNVSAGTCNGAITVDPTKISIALTSEGFNSSGVLGTVARTITIVSATVSASTLTCDLSEPIYNDDTSVSVTLLAAAFTDVTPDTSDALGSTSVDLVTTPSTVDYALHSGIHFIDPPHQRYTGSTFDLRALGLHQYGWAAVKLGITRCLEVTGTGGITGTFAYPETVTFAGVGPGGTGVLAPGSDLTGAGTKVLRVFMRTGVATIGDTATGGTSTASIVVTSTAGGGETSGFATFTTRTRDGSYGPATIQDVWSRTITPPAVDRYERWMIWYPTVGDTSWDSRSLSVRSANNVLTADSCRGEWEIYCDPGDTLSGSQKNYYVDSTSTAAASGGTTGTFGQFEFCKNMTGASLSGVVVAIGDNSAGTQSTTNFRYNALPTGVVVYTVDQTASEPTGIIYGDIIAVSGTFGTSTITAFVLEYNATTKILTYALTAGTNFTAADSIVTYDRDGVSRSIAFTLGTPGAASTTAPASGDVITGYSSGATCTLTGAPAANGSDAAAGTSGAPFLTMQKAMKQASTDRGDSLCDGVTIYLTRGHHRMVYAAGNEAESRDYYCVITKAPGIETDNVRITRYNTASTNGNLTNFQKWYQVTFWGWSSTSGVNILTMQSGGNVTGSYDRPAYWFDGCEFISFFRWTRGLPFAWATSAAPFYSAITNSRLTRCHCAAHMYRDVLFRTIADDLTTTGRAVFNLDATDVSAANTTLHSDIWQGQGTENGNLLIWGLRGLTLSNVQQAPFMSSATGTVDSFGFVNMLQGLGLNSQMGNAAGAGTFTIEHATWVRCSYADNYLWRSSAAGRNLTLVNLRVALSVWLTHTKTESGTVTGIRPGCYWNNHFVTSPANNGYQDTTTTAFSTIFTEASDETSSNFFKPIENQAVDKRYTLATQPNGWPKYDIFGTALPTSPAIGSVQYAASTPLSATATADSSSIVANVDVEITVIATGGTESYTYSWVVITSPAGATSSFGDNTAATTTFRANRTGVYLIRVTVDDGSTTTTADINLMVNGEAPRTRDRIRAR